MKPRKTKGFPLVTMPDEYIIQTNQCTQAETQYIQKRNDYLHQFISLLDKGIDPFDGIGITFYHFDSIRKYKVALRIEEEISWGDIIPIQSLDTFLFVTENDTDYIIIRAVDVWDGRHIFLFSDQFEFLDVLSHGGNDAEYEASAIVSIKHPNHFWFHTSMYRGPYRLCIVEINNGLLCCTMRFGCFSLFLQEKEPFFVNEDYFLYVDGQGRGSHIDGYNYVDPWSGEYVNQFFLKEMEQQLDYLYSCYHYYRSFLLVPGKIPRAGGSFLKLEEDRYKPLYITDAFYILEYFESIFYIYGFLEPAVGS